MSNEKLKKEIGKINSGEIAQVAALIRKHYMGQLSEHDLLKELLAFDPYFIIKGFMKEMNLDKAVSGQLLHATKFGIGQAG